MTRSEFKKGMLALLLMTVVFTVALIYSLTPDAKPVIDEVAPASQYYEQVTEPEQTDVTETCPPCTDICAAEQDVQSETYIGVYKLTAYCACEKCCGKWAGGTTASGTIPAEGRTVSCNSLPMGTQIKIDGQVYTVEDTGNMASNVIDVYYDSHSAALEFGVKYADVYITK